MTLVATSTSGCTYTASRSTGAARGTGEGAAAAAAAGGAPPPPPLPEELGRAAAGLLLDEIERGGCVDSRAQPLVLLLMALGPEDVSRVRLGQLSPAAVATLRLLKAFFGVTFKLATQARVTGGPAPPAAEGGGGGAAPPPRGAAKRAREGAGGGEEGGGGGGGGGEPPAAPVQLLAAGGHSNNTVLVSCLGIGFKSIAKRVT